MANALVKKATKLVNGKLCSISNDVQVLKACFALNHPIMVALNKDKANEQWVNHVRDLLNQIDESNDEALDWNRAIQADLE